MPEKIDSGLTAEKVRSVLSKGDSRYWLEGGRLFKNHTAADYCCRFTTRGRREHFSLGSANKKTAAAKAAEIFNFIQSDGWEAATELYKAKAEKLTEVRVGDLISEARRHSSARPQSFDAYTKALRRVISEIRKIPKNGRYDARGGGATTWQAKVDSVPLASITPAEVKAWKNRRLRKAGSDPLSRRRAVVTTNSLIRNASALFGKKILPDIEESIPLPRPLPFEGVKLEKSPSLRYRSRIDPYAILASAMDDLAGSDPEAFKILLLALVCGLRRSEIDNLLWRSLDFPNSKIHVEATEYHQLKSEDSAGEIDLDEDTLVLFRGWRAKEPKALFVIESPKDPRPDSPSRYYRCDDIFKRVTDWLRTQGVDDPKPLHTLRKEIGSVIASEHGIFEASRYLRHSDIRITSAIYADKKKTVTPRAFEGLLSSEHTEDPVPMDKDSNFRNTGT